MEINKCEDNIILLVLISFQQQKYLLYFIPLVIFGDTRKLLLKGFGSEVLDGGWMESGWRMDGGWMEDG